MGLLRGEWWIDSNGQSTFADGSVGDQNHESIAYASFSELGHEDIIPENSEQFAALFLRSEQVYDEVEQMKPSEFSKWARAKSVKLKRKGNFTNIELVALQQVENMGGNVKFFEWMWDKGQAADVRDYAMEHGDWVRVEGDHFQVWNFDDAALGRIKNFQGWDEVDDPDGLEDSEHNVYIEQMKDNKLITVSVRDLFRAKSAEGLVRYKEGIGKWRNPPR